MRARLRRVWQELRRRPWRVAAALLLSAALLCFYGALPAPLIERPLSAALYDRNGELLGARIAADGQWRFAAPEQVPEKLAAALVQFEDKRFWRHPGVDPLALARALREAARHGEVRSGASTLSMQLIRLSRDNPPRTVGEKFIEMLLALRLELRHSKNEILALYAGHAPYGGNVVGIEAAAWRYFGHAPEQLSWAEAATLAVLPNSPALIHPGRGRELLLKKRNRVLDGLLAAGSLDAMSHALALAERLPAAPKPLPRLAPHLLDTVLARGEAVERQVTTLERGLQQRVSKLIDDAAERYSAQAVHNAAALVIDNAAMAVRAYAGNARRTSSAESERGYAVDIIKSPRSTGSLLKPFLFAALLQDGQLQPGSLVPDIPTHFTGFKPENFDHGYRGAVRAREALAQSLNVPAVYMLRDYGIPRFYDLLRQMDMGTLTRRPDDYGLSLILGGAEGTLWDLAQMYANLARISESGLRRGAANYEALRVRGDAQYAPGAKTEIGSGAAYLTLDALQEVSRPELERHWKNFSSARKLAWKTGTSYGLRDGWAIGVTPRHTVAVWVGNASGEGRAGLTGATLAAPILFDIFNELNDHGWFKAPRANLREVAVCVDDGYLPSHGCTTEQQWVPADAHFEAVSRYHQTVHLDPARRQRVHSRCESVAHMEHRSWFVLPPAQEHYYRLHNASYRSLPRYREDCLAHLESAGARRAFDIIYPDSGLAVYIPEDFGGARGQLVLEAVHRDSQATLHWHVDERYAGSTRDFHQLKLDLPPGEHRLTVVDESGQRQTRRFTVLEKQARREG